MTPRLTATVDSNSPSPGPLVVEPVERNPLGVEVDVSVDVRREAAADPPRFICAKP
jgi:hypothetical protein